MKYLTTILFLGTLIALSVMLSIQKMYEVKHNIDFSIMQYEWPQDKASLDKMIKEDNATIGKKEFVVELLSYDYIFMAFIFPFLISFCLLSKENLDSIFININEKIGKRLRLMLNVLAVLVFLAWLFDYCENARLEKWMIEGEVGSMFAFKAMVFLKFSIGISAFLTSIGVLSYTKILKSISK